MSDPNPSPVAPSEVSAVETRLDVLSGQIAALTQQLAEIRRLVGPFAVPMPDGRMLVQTIQNIKYLIDPRDLIMAPQMIVYRQWEPDLSALVSGLLKPDSVFVDVGANFGYFTCLAGSQIGRGGTGRVLAVEPNPALVSLLRANVQINWSMCPIEIFPIAAGAEAGKATLSVPLAGAANASLSAGAHGAEVAEVAVDLVPLDAIVPAGTAIDLVKIDVEGHEMGVLLGARRVFAESPSIIVVLEWSLGQMKSAGYGPERMADLIDEYGFSVFEVPANGRTVDWTPMPRERLLAIPYANLLLKRSSGG